MKTTMLKKGMVFQGITVLAILLAGNSFAQGGLLESSSRSEVGIEITKASFSEENKLSFTTSVITLRGQARLPNGFYLIGEIPISNKDLGEGRDYDAQTIIGNPYMGVRYERDGSSPVFALGIRPSVISEENADAMIIGVITEFQEMEAFVPELTTISLLGGYKYTSPDNFSVKFLLGSSLWLPSESQYDPEVFAEGRLEFLFTPEKFNFGFGIGSKTMLTEFAESDIDFNGANYQYFRFAAGYDLGQVTPGVHFTVPTDEDYIFGFKQSIDYTWGIDLKTSLE